MIDWAKLDFSTGDRAEFYAFGHTVEIDRKGRRWSVRAYAPGAQSGLSDPPVPAFSADFFVDMGDRVRFRPLLPDRPVVVILADPFILYPQESVSGTVLLPCDLRAERADGQAVIDIPLVGLPPTWFGDEESGELCFALRTSMSFLALEEALSRSFETEGILCPVTFRNLSRAPVRIETFSVPAESCPVRIVRGIPVTDEVVIHGEADGDLNIEIRELSDGGSRVELLSPARVSRSDKLIKKGLGFLSSITGLHIG